MLNDTTISVVEIVKKPQKEEPTEEKKERKPRKKKGQSPEILSLLEFIKKEWQKVGTVGKLGNTFFPLQNSNGRQVVKVMFTKEKALLFTRCPDALKWSQETRVYNSYGLPYTCVFERDTDETRDAIKAIFQIVLDEDTTRRKRVKKESK